MLSIEFFTLTSIYFLALLSPGQDFFLILRTALLHGYKLAWWSCFGIALGNTLYIALAYIGHETLIQFPLLLPTIELLGALFLVYLGYILITAPKPTYHQSVENSLPSRRKLFNTGFLSAILNPKNTLFYLSILFTIVSPQTSLYVKVVYAVWMISLLLLWDMFVAFLLGHQKASRLLALLYPIQKLIGGGLLLFGIYELYLKLLA
ncbi:MAG: LysE family translocator [Sulfurospirillaceae bacterium]|nr:LysE family translocator [Sulfurospirillaceae bacterium]